MLVSADSESEADSEGLPTIVPSPFGSAPSPEPATLPERIRAAKRREGISQRELARRLGVDESTVQAWEAGTVRRRYRAAHEAL